MIWDTRGYALSFQKLLWPTMCSGDPRSYSKDMLWIPGVRSWMQFTTGYPGAGSLAWTTNTWYRSTRTLWAPSSALWPLGMQCQVLETTRNPTPHRNFDLFMCSTCLLPLRMPSVKTGCDCRRSSFGITSRTQECLRIAPNPTTSVHKNRHRKEQQGKGNSSSFSILESSARAEFCNVQV